MLICDDGSPVRVTCPRFLEFPRQRVGRRTHPGGRYGSPNLPQRPWIV